MESWKCRSYTLWHAWDRWAHFHNSGHTSGRLCQHSSLPVIYPSIHTRILSVSYSSRIIRNTPCSGRGWVSNGRGECLSRFLSKDLWSLPICKKYRWITKNIQAIGWSVYTSLLTRESSSRTWLNARGARNIMAWTDTSQSGDVKKNVLSD